MQNKEFWELFLDEITDSLGILSFRTIIEAYHKWLIEAKKPESERKSIDVFTQRDSVSLV